MLYWDVIHHIFMELDSSAAKKEDIMKAGEQTNISLSWGTGESLDDLRLQVFHKKSLQKYILCSTAEFSTNLSSKPSTTVWGYTNKSNSGLE